MSRKRRRVAEEEHHALHDLCIDVLSVVASFMNAPDFLHFALSFQCAASACRQSLNDPTERRRIAMRLLASGSADQLQHFIEVYPPFVPGKFDQDFAMGVESVLYPMYSEIRPPIDICYDGRKSVLCDRIPALKMLFKHGFQPTADMFRRSCLWRDRRICDLFVEAGQLSCYCIAKRARVDVRYYVIEDMHDSLDLWYYCDYHGVCIWLFANGIPFTELKKLCGECMSLGDFGEARYESVVTMEEHERVCYTSTQCHDGEYTFPYSWSDADW